MNKHATPASSAAQVEIPAPAGVNAPGFGSDVVADTRRMNAWLEGVVRTMPAQYYWVHRRFKTRPDGEPPLYG